MNARHGDFLRRAADIAERVLFAAALSVDAADRIPVGHLDLLAAEGLYGMVGPAEYGDAECRTALRTGQPEALPAARAAASELAVRAASTLMVRTGSGSVLRDTHAQRLAREAHFLLVFGSRPAIREPLLARLTGAHPASMSAQPG